MTRVLPSQYIATMLCFTVPPSAVFWPLVWPLASQRQLAQGSDGVFCSCEIDAVASCLSLTTWRLVKRLVCMHQKCLHSHLIMAKCMIPSNIEHMHWIIIKVLDVWASQRKTCDPISHSKYVREKFGINAKLSERENCFSIVSERPSQTKSTFNARSNAFQYKAHPSDLMLAECSMPHNVHVNFGI